MLLVDDFESAPVMGWISPKGEVHELGGYNNHDRWAYAKHGVSADFLMSKGWVRKAHRDSYEAGSDSALPRVLKHVRRHHPDVGEFYFDTPSQKTLGGVRTWLVPVSRPGAKQLLGEGMKEIIEAIVRGRYTGGRGVDPVAQWNAYFNNRPAGWITPTGDFHSLSSLPDGKRTHPRWIEANQDIVKQYGHLVVKGPHAAENTHDAMMRGGWVQKENKDRYRVWGPEALKTVQDHVKKHHPETREVTVEIVNPAKGGTSFKSPVYESEDAMRASLASWLIHIALGGGAGGHRSLDRYGLQEP
jgi:hypothetical protein